jgi:HlyD family secretion protein
MTLSRLSASVVAAALLSVALAGCSNGDTGYQGWVEANLIFVGPDEAGRVETLTVREGDPITKDAPLFVLESDLQRADVAMQETAVLNAKQAFDRAQQLLKTAAGTQKTYEDAEAALRTAQARLNSARTQLNRRSIKSPVTGTVQQVYFRPGELVPAGRPIVALLTPGNVKVRFYVPEAVLPRIAYGDTVKVQCDGCTADLTAKISFIARTAEFTPPVIYSTEERNKLVFLVEAWPDQPDKLRVGQPLNVTLVPNDAQAREGQPQEAKR